MLGINAIKITPDILKKVCTVDEFKGLWRGLERHTTGLNLLGDVADYGANFQQVLGALREKPLTSDIIKALHAHQVGESGPSRYRIEPNELPITSGNELVGVLQTAEPDHVGPLMDKLCDWVNETLNNKSLHPLLTAAVFMSVFLQVSPFDTGNLRTARFVALLILLRAGYTYAPYASLSAIMDEHAGRFYKALLHNQASLEDGNPDWSVWLDWFLDMLTLQTETLYARLYEKETELQNVSVLSARIMTLFKDHARLQMKEIIKLTNGRRATIKLRLLELVERGYLKRHGAGRATWYSLV